MLVVFVTGLLVGYGLWLALTVMQPETTPLDLAAERLNRPAERQVVAGSSATSSSATGSLPARLGAFVLPHLSPGRMQKASVQSDLAVIGRPLDVHLGQKVLWAFGGGLAIPVSAALASLNGAHVSMAIPAWLSLIAAVGGFFLPDLSIRQLAAARRHEFRQSLGAYIDLVVMLLAANEGVTGALEHGALAGDSWPFLELRRVLAEARLTATTPWAAMRDLGERYGVDELIEMSSAAHLAGAEGVSMRQSLTAKARTLRDRALSAEEAKAQQSSTRMVFPLLLLVMSFVFFVGYPAFVSVLNT